MKETVPTISELELDRRSLRYQGVQLFKFLREAVRLRYKQKLPSLPAPEEAVWLSDLDTPLHKCVKCPLLQPGEAVGEFWLEVKRPNRKPAPSLPDKLKAWVDPQVLLNSSTTPGPNSHRVGGTDEDGNSIIVEWQDEEDLHEIWQEYLEEKWVPWAEADRPNLRVEEVYLKLYRLYQYWKREAEEREIVIGAGCLQLRYGQIELGTHLVEMQATLEFDPEAKTIRVISSSNTVEPLLVHEDLPRELRPETTDLDSVRAHLSEAGLSLHDPAIHVALKSWVQCLPDHLLPLDKGYEEGTQRRTRPSSTAALLLDWAPAIIIRRRQGKSLLKIYEDLKQLLLRQDFDAESTMNAPLLRLLGEKDPAEVEESGVPGLTELLFPLAANDDQRHVARLIRRRPVVVVQGPPGTGKSQTITNLICHLLAQGKRVLVTSHTSRALRVLREKLANVPGDISQLSVVLTDDADYRKQLERSVGQIVNRFNEFNEPASVADTRRFDEELDRLGSRHARTFKDLLEARSSTTNQDRDCFGFRGSFQSILRQIRLQEEELGWLSDQPDEDTDPPLTPAELEECHRLCELGPAPEEMIESAYPDLNQLPDPIDFQRHVERLHVQERQIAEDTATVPEEEAKRLSAMGEEKLEVLRSGIERLANQQRELERIGWLPSLLRDCFSGNRLVWETRLQNSRKHLASFGNSVEFGLPEIAGVPETNIEVLKANAVLLQSRIREKGKLGIALFWPKDVKQAVQLLADVRMNGLPLKTDEDYDRFIFNLETQQQEMKFNLLWAELEPPPIGDPRIRMAYCERRLEDLEKALSFATQIEDAKRKLASRVSIDLARVAQGPAALQDALKISKAASNHLALEAEQIRSVIWHSHLQQVRNGRRAPHELVANTSAALTALDPAAYTTIHRDLATTLDLRSKFIRRNELASRLANAAPLFASWMAEHWHELEATQRVATFHRAWTRERARQRVLRLDNPQERDRLQIQLKLIEAEISATLGKLAGAKAWLKALNNLTNDDVEYLKLWQQAVKKVGKGTGKHAAHFRRIAQEHLEQCVSAVPAWIMPIHRVAETFNVSNHPFDVIIVDEASQAGIESLFLTQMSRTLLVVGDDKQISPTSFAKQEELNALVAEYLGGIRISGILNDSEASLFKVADIISVRSNRMLREHFRCMPEIIEFSNSFVYDNRLIPLKQFGGSRLEPPVKAVLVPDGRAGEKNERTNPAEAEAVVRAMIACMNDPDYAGKSMGVIGLLGTEQSELIRSKLERAASPEQIEKFRIVCGEAYAFQGDERDVMFLSLVSSPDRPGSSLTKDSDRQRFNVAASRAREQVWLFHSVGPAQYSHSESVKRQLLEYFLQPKRGFIPFLDMRIDELQRMVKDSNRPSHPHLSLKQWFHSWFEAEVALALLERGYRLQPQYKVGAYSIDLVIQGHQGMVAIECDGDHWHGPEQEENDLRRQIQIEGAGFVFHRVRGSRWENDPQMAMVEIEDFLRQHHIFPAGQEPTAAIQTTVQIDAEEFAAEEGAGEIISDMGDSGRSSDEDLLPPIVESYGDQSEVAGQREQDREAFTEGNASAAAEGEGTHSLFEQELGDPLPNPVREYLKGLPEYKEWEPEHRQPLHLLREGLDQWILEAIEIEGPVKGSRLLRRIMDFVDGPTQNVRNAYDRSVAEINRKGQLLRTHETDEPGILINDFIRKQGSRAVNVRTHGPRLLSEIPPSETKVLIRRIRGMVGMTDHLTKLAVARFYGTDSHGSDFAALYKLAVQMIDE
ncbi:AAA family ATPase [bacterium]|nr:AAA family ATPase [bacterium]